MSKIEIEIDCNIEDASNDRPSERCIQYRDYSSLKYNDFFELMKNNSPCVIKNVTSAWECSKNWVNNNSLNYDYLIQQYGDLDAPVANCNNINYNAHCKSTMKVKDYMDYLKDNHKQELLYLKDWHLKRVKPEHNFYDVPFIFASDWLNEFSLDHEEDDFMFVYIGPENSWTPFHADVYSSFSWSVNVFGRKKWILLPPGEEDKLKDNFGNLPILFEKEKFPNVEYIEVIQEMGDAIFVPSEWHHQVTNEKLTVSINHNFINACNISMVWKSLQSNLLLVEREIQDLKDTPEFGVQCQLILKSSFGMDIESFVNFVKYIGKKRLKQINGDKYYLFNTFIFKTNHILYDLYKIIKILDLIETHPYYCNLPPNVSSYLTHVKKSIHDYLYKK